MADTSLHFFLPSSKVIPSVSWLPWKNLGNISALILFVKIRGL